MPKNVQKVKLINLKTIQFHCGWLVVGSWCKKLKDHLPQKERKEEVKPGQCGW